MAVPSGESQRVETGNLDQTKESQQFNPVIEGGTRSSFKAKLNEAKLGLERILKRVNGGDNVNVAAFEREYELPDAKRTEQGEFTESISDQLNELQQNSEGFATLREFGDAIVKIAESGSDKDAFLTYKIIGFNTRGVQIKLNYKNHTAETTYIGPITGELRANMKKELADKKDEVAKLSELKVRVVVHPEPIPRRSVNEESHVNQNSSEITSSTLPEAVDPKGGLTNFDQGIKKTANDQEKIMTRGDSRSEQRKNALDPKNYPGSHILRGEEIGALEAAKRSLAQGVPLSEFQAQVVAKAKWEEYTAPKRTRSLLELANLKNIQKEEAFLGKVWMNIVGATKKEI